MRQCLPITYPTLFRSTLGKATSPTNLCCAKTRLHHRRRRCSDQRQRMPSMGASLLPACVSACPIAGKCQLVEHSAKRRARRICVAQKHACITGVDGAPTNGNACHRWARHCSRHASVPAHYLPNALPINTRQSDEPDEFVLRKNTPASQASTVLRPTATHAIDG